MGITGIDLFEPLVDNTTVATNIKFPFAFQ